MTDGLRIADEFISCDVKKLVQKKYEFFSLQLTSKVE